MTPHEFRDALTILGWSNRHAATTMGVTLRTIQNWRSGATEVPVVVAGYLRLNICENRITGDP